MGGWPGDRIGLEGHGIERRCFVALLARPGRPCTVSDVERGEQAVAHRRTTRNGKFWFALASGPRPPAVLSILDLLPPPGYNTRRRFQPKCVLASRIITGEGICAS